MLPLLGATTVILSILSDEEKATPSYPLGSGEPIPTLDDSLLETHTGPVLDFNHECWIEEQGWSIDWPGYKVSVTYTAITWTDPEAESYEEEHGYDLEDEHAFTLKDALEAGGSHSWCEWSSGGPNHEGDWICSEGEENWKTGENTTYDLFLERLDGKPLTPQEVQFINQTLWPHRQERKKCPSP